MTKEELYQLTTKFLNETLSAEEKERLEQWYRQGTDEEVVIHVSSESPYSNESELKSGILQRINRELANEEIQVTPVRRMRYGRWAAAAAVILIAGAGSYFWLSGRKTEVALASTDKPVQTDVSPGGNKAILTIGSDKQIALASNKTGIAVGGSITYNDGEKIADAGQLLELSTPMGGQYQAVLPDGTKVWLNAASSIKFPSKFSGSERNIEITGEVYLEIARNPKQPFIVKANGTEVQVLGTSFNISAYSDENVIKTTLIEGSVKVVKGNSEAILKPGEACSVIGDRSSVAANADIDQALAWKNGLFSFNNADIKTIMRQLARWYNINIVYEKDVPAQRFFGEMHRNLTLSQVLKGLEVSQVHFRLEGRNLVVMP